ncbi:protein transport protein SEC31 homolog B-like [Bidens hawaiensis]|uniref:protein transport protein SEC31 homolog B-like n=1 Tax=Bidens hawaiensis TaxID=980011 RepID=UPI0040496FD9
MNTSQPCIKEVVRSALVAFAPDAPFLAAGTMAGAVDMSFSSSANLEIFQLDFQSDDRKLPLAGYAPSSEPFNRLSWGKSFGSEEFSLGLVAGGLVDGNIGIWNPRLLISSEESENALVQNLSRHKGPVRGLEFSSLSPNHLASGAEEGDICIWDIAKPAEPTHFPPLKGTGSAAQGEISYVSWNKKVQPILASTSLNGTTVVWDLRKQKPIISFSDSVKRRCSVLQWHPDFATQLIVASDDDSSPSLRIWDMRNTMSPLRELSGHTKGVVAMSWCPIDSTYLVTCGKDNRTICWDTNSTEIVSELPAGTNWNFDVHWYPKIPGVISASSFDGKIGVYNIEACARYGVGESYIVSAPLKAPKWYQRKAGVTFGFGGKLVSFHSTGSSSNRSEVSMQDLVTELNLVNTSSEFEAAMKSGDKSSLRLLCEQKYLESESEDDKETWGFLKVMFEDDGAARTKLLNHLGFTLPPEVTEATDLTHNMSSLNVKQNEVATEELVGDNGEDFFNNLPSPKVDTPVSTLVNKFGTEESVADVDKLTRRCCQKRFSASLCKLPEKYVEILASQGLLTTALEYLKLMGNEDLSPELVILRDRITLSSEPEKEATRSMDSVNSQLPTATAYGFNQQNSVDSSRNYYQDDASYNRQNYQQTPVSSYATQYQPQHPTTFVPAPAPQIPPVGFTPQLPVQPAPKLFVPSAMPVIKNADQYQQAPTLGSQIYPSQVNPGSNYQVGPPAGGSLGPVPSPTVPTPVQRMTPDVGPTPPVRGFMPMPISSNTGGQRTGPGQMQPPSPPQPAAPSAPPPTVHTADVTNVPAHHRPVINTLKKLFTETSEAMGGPRAVPAKKREIDDNSKKLGALFVKLNNGDISKNASDKLIQLCQALDIGDFTTALKIQVELTTCDWDECSFWLATLKRMIRIRQTGR